MEKKNINDHSKYEIFLLCKLYTERMWNLNHTNLLFEKYIKHIIYQQKQHISEIKFLMNKKKKNPDTHKI